MSYDDGWAAINLQMPKRVPRTEYSAAEHWDLIKAVTGIDVGVNSPDDIKRKAARAFVGPDGWNYDFFWSILIGATDLGEYRTEMGHAEYAAGGTDFYTNRGSAFKGPEDVLSFVPYDSLPSEPHDKMVKRFEEDYAATCRNNPDGVNMTGVYTTCMSGLIHLFGWDFLLMAAGIDADGLGKVTNSYARWMQRYFDALGEANAPVVMIHDDIVWTEGAFMHPDWYRKYIFPNYKKYFAPLIESGKKIMYTSDGNYTEFVDDLAACGIHGFVMEPTTDMKYIAEKYGKTHVFIGNADTRILLSGSKDEIRREVERCMAVGKKYPGFFMAVGNHIPSNTPVENALYYNEVYQELSRR